MALLLTLACLPAWAGQWRSFAGDWSLGESQGQRDAGAWTQAFDLSQAFEAPRVYARCLIAAEGEGVRAAQLVLGATSNKDFYYAHFDSRNSCVTLVRSSPTQAWNELARQRGVPIEPDVFHQLGLTWSRGQLVAWLDGKQIVSAALPQAPRGYSGVGTSQARALFEDYHSYGRRIEMPFEEKHEPFVVVCEDGGAGGYEAFPDVVRLQDGDLLAVCYAGYDHISWPAPQLPKGGRVVSVRSKDNGLTWGKAEIVYDSEIDNRDPHISQSADGTVFVTWFDLVTHPVRGFATAGQWFVRSFDGGHTWEQDAHLISMEYAASAPIRQLPDGDLILGLYTESNEHAYGATTKSRDGGLTWETPVDIGKESPIRHDAETDVVLLKSGKLLAALRPTMSYALSDDLGESWGPIAPFGFEGHAPYFLYTSGGVLLLAHRLPQTSLHYSLDDGATWQGPVLVDDVIGSYCSMQELPDGTVIIVYYTEGPGSDIRARFFKADATGITFLDPEELRARFSRS